MNKRAKWSLKAWPEEIDDKELDSQIVDYPSFASKKQKEQEMGER